MTSDFVEIKKSAKTTSCCFHYLMHLQSGKWTRKKTSEDKRKPPYRDISLQTCMKASEEMVWQVLSHLVPSIHYREPSSLHTAP